MVEIILGLTIGVVVLTAAVAYIILQETNKMSYSKTVDQILKFGISIDTTQVQMTDNGEYAVWTEEYIDEQDSVFPTAGEAFDALVTLEVQKLIKQLEGK